jgi:esterase/lipase superfamily enzyme
MTSALQKSMAERGTREVLLFVHGFNNNFDDAALAMADLWHFVGRAPIPIFYTWPAASGGMFGYFKDRESGEFSIFHLKETLRILASMEKLEGIHIVAHSRGTDLITTALRELVIEARAGGNSPLSVLKIKNLILAAPDLDFGVVRQRLFAEKFGPAIGQITVYMNSGDEALSISQYLSSGLRFGKLGESDLFETDKQIFEQVKNVNFITVEGVRGVFGHNYYRTHPGVLSDIAIIVQKAANPGDTARPLQHDRYNFWTLQKDYPSH